MKVRIEFELDTAGLDDGQQEDYIDDLTYEMRTSRLVVPGSWRIDY